MSSSGAAQSLETNTIDFNRIECCCALPVSKFLGDFVASD
jgi:hypothetical protein